MDKYKLDDSDDDDDQDAKPQSAAAVQARSFQAPKPISYRDVKRSDSKDFVELYESSKQKPEEEQVFRDRDLIESEERLENDFAVTAWVPPQFIKAEQVASERVYRAGVAAMDSVDLVRDVEAGVAVNVYFQLVRSLSIAFLVMSLLALPSLVFAYYGKGLPLQDGDVIGLSSLTIANIGFDYTSADYDVVSKCNSVVANGTSQHNTLIVNSHNPSDTCVSVDGYLFTTQSVSLIITLCEVLQVMVFLIATIHFHRCIDAILHRHAEEGYPSLRDYSVQVTNLPRNTTVKELLDHFSALYQLERTDWRGRPPVDGAGPVDSAAYSGDSMFRGTWVAQCTVNSRVREIVYYLERRKYLMEKLYLLRARMKMCGLQTPHKKGFIATKWLKLERQMLRVARRVDHANKKIYLGQVDVADKSDVLSSVAQSKTAAEREVAESMIAPGNSSKKKPDDDVVKLMVDDGDVENQDQPLDLIDTEIDEDDTKAVTVTQTLSTKEKEDVLMKHFKQNPAVSAFVTFEYNESFARCVDDHSFYALPWLAPILRMCFPRKLMFKGKCLHVVRAPEPDQIVWESIEVSSVWKAFKRVRTWLFLLVLFACVYAGFAACAYLRVQYQNQQPMTGLCASILPRSYDIANSSIVDYTSIAFARSSNSSQRELLDNQCERAVNQSSYYAIFAYDGLYEEPVVEYSVSACLNNTANITSTSLCPSYGAEQYCPCVAQDSTEICYSSGCYTTDTGDMRVHLNVSSKSCVEFEAGNIAKCFCRYEVDENIRKHGFIWMLASFVLPANTLADDKCNDMSSYYSSSNIAILVMVPLTMLSSFLIRRIIVANIAGEYYSTVDEQNIAIAWRLCISDYVNFGLLPLVAFGRSSAAPSSLIDYHLFAGPYVEFSREWYGTVGFYLVILFFLKTFPPIAASYFSFYYYRPWKTYYAQSYLVNLNSYRYALQSQVNEVLVDGRSFDVPSRTGAYLAWVFIAMTYSAGLPILLVLAALAMVLLYRMDRLFYCRFYQKQPSASSEGLGRWVASFLPYAAICKLAFSIFILSSDGIISSEWPTVQTPHATQGQVSTGGLSIQNYMHAVHHTLPSLIDKRLPSQLEFLQRRVLRANTFPLMFVIIIILLSKLIRKGWFLLPPVLISKLLNKVLSLLCKFRRFQASENKRLMVHPYDLTFGLSDELRCQEAPLSGGYSKYLRHSADRPITVYNTFCCCFSLIYKSQSTVEQSELPPNWEILQIDSAKGPFNAKIKTWPMKMQFDGQGDFHLAGDQKNTFDLIAERRCNSYKIEKIPKYSEVGFMLRKQKYSSIVNEFQQWKMDFERKNFIIGETRRQKAQRVEKELQKIDKHLAQRGDFKFGIKTKVNEDKSNRLFSCFGRRKETREIVPLVNGDSDSEDDDFYRQQQHKQKESLSKSSPKIADKKLTSGSEPVLKNSPDIELGGVPAARSGWFARSIKAGKEADKENVAISDDSSDDDASDDNDDSDDEDTDSDDTNDNEWDDSDDSDSSSESSDSSLDNG